MPGIKKKWIKASHKEQIAKDDEIGDEDRELADDTDNDAVKVSASSVTKAKKRPAPGPGGLMRGMDGEVLLEKRKRFTPPAEIKLAEWLDNNLEQRTEETMNQQKLYDYYTQLCQGSEIIDIPVFQQRIKQKFGKSFGLKETSLLKTVLKERKLIKEKKKLPGGISVKDAALEAINSFGNPWHGVSFLHIKNYIGTHYPALQIDYYPNRLKTYLEMGKIDRVKGFGKLGFYKIPGGEEAPPPEPKKAKKEAKKEGDDETGKAEGEEDSSAKDDDGPKENGDAEGDKKEEETVKKEKKKTTYKPVDISRIPHGDPQKIEDTFPLAITYQSAPKAVSINRIRKYILEKYGNDVTDKRWRSVIEKGVDKRYWEHVSGSGLSGVLHLLMDDFDPTSEDLEDQICAAIIACHEPKSAGASSIKKYITKYHPDFDVEAKPQKFKQALVRAVEKKIIVQLSGIGASGSFQLTTSFQPSPTVLAGEEDSEEEEEEEDDDSNYYKPKGTKSRAVSNIKRLDILTSPSRMRAATGTSNKAKGKSQKAKSADKKGTKVSKNAKAKGRGRPKGRKRSPSPLTDEEEEEWEKPAKSSSKKQKSPAKRKRSPSPLTDEEEEDKAEYTPVKSKSRSRPAKAEPAKNLKAKIVKDGKGANTLKVNISTSSAKKSKKSSSRERSSTKSKKSQPEEEEEEEEEMEEVEIVKKSSSKKSTPSNKSKKSQPEEEEEEEEMEEMEIVKKSSKKSTSSKKAKNSEPSDDEEDEKPEYTPRKSQSRGGTQSSEKPSKKRRGR